jgi:hypothetical protein
VVQRITPHKPVGDMKDLGSFHGSTLGIPDIVSETISESTLQAAARSTLRMASTGGSGHGLIRNGRFFLSPVDPMSNNLGYLSSFRCQTYHQLLSNQDTSKCLYRGDNRAVSSLKEDGRPKATVSWIPLSVSSCSIKIAKVDGEYNPSKYLHNCINVS